jgi:ABC-2 type transport system permease protein
MTGTLGRRGFSSRPFSPARAVHAEWTKVRTVAGTFWLLIGAIVLTVTVSTAAAAGARRGWGSVLAGRLILPARGGTAARGFPPLWPGDGPALRAAAGSVLYLALIERYSTMNAGLTIQDTTGLHNLPVSPWGGLGILAAWAAALLTGGLMLRWRDA